MFVFVIDPPGDEYTGESIRILGKGNFFKHTSHVPKYVV
jgi:hypothetical protein